MISCDSRRSGDRSSYIESGTHAHLMGLKDAYFHQGYIRECATHNVVVQTSLFGFDVTAVPVVGHEYD